MKKAAPWYTVSNSLFRLALKSRRLLRKKRCQAFGTFIGNMLPKITKIYVINLDRQPDRLTYMEHELRHVLDYSGVELWNLTTRYAAIDARHFLEDSRKDADIDPNYTLGDQLFVEPQPLAFPSQLDLNSSIQMSRPEIAVAHSHINIWKEVATSTHDYVLVLEDDVWFRPGFTRRLNRAWKEITAENGEVEFDIFYLSYEEVKHGAPKTILSSEIFRPIRGLWNLSGYVISRKGAQKLLQLLPCRGPIDLWINHQFKVLNVCATKRSIISQRHDLSSSNSYSILPTLTKIGAITSESASLFQTRPVEQPIFAFGAEDTGLTSLAMALSMLGYRCCNDLQTLPKSELEKLLTGRSNQIFNAYVNIQHLKLQICVLKDIYPQAKFFLTTDITSLVDEENQNILDNLAGSDLAIVDIRANDKWQIICDHLRCSPPACSFPNISELGQRRLGKIFDGNKILTSKVPKRDKSPWVIETNESWKGIYLESEKNKKSFDNRAVIINDYFESLTKESWLLRNDTFTDNLALFHPGNIKLNSDMGLALSIRKESVGVRKYTAASLTSRNQYLYGRFEAVIKASNVPGIITGFFLHRNSPRQEIDIEISGNRPSRLLINVFYNPGSEGAPFDYGYRGSPTYIDLGFDASKSYHCYAIEWTPTQINWFVDNHLVHRRVLWDPTPIPNLPMALHMNIWPCRSKELAGRLVNRKLPTTSLIKSVSIKANQL